MSASADPSALARYATGTREADVAVATAARRLENALADLVGSRPEGLTVDTGLSPAVAAHASACAVRADRTGAVGAAFDAADRGGFIGPVPPRVVHGPDPVVPSGGQGLSAAQVSTVLSVNSAGTTALGIIAGGADTAHGRLLVRDADARAARTVAQNAYRAAPFAERAAAWEVRAAARMAAHETADLVKGNAAKPFVGLPLLDRARPVGPLRITALGTGAGVLTVASTLASGGSAGDATVALGLSVAAGAAGQAIVGGGVSYLATGGLFLVPGVGQVALTAAVVVGIGYGLTALARTDVGEAVTGKVADVVDGALEKGSDLVGKAWDSVFG